MCHVRGRGEALTGFWQANLQTRGHLEVLGLDYKVMLKWTLKKNDESANCIDLIQSKEKWQAVVGSVMNIRVVFLDQLRNNQLLKKDCAAWCCFMGGLWSLNNEPNIITRFLKSASRRLPPGAPHQTAQCTLCV